MVFNPVGVARMDPIEVTWTIYYKNRLIKYNTTNAERPAHRLLGENAMIAKPMALLAQLAPLQDSSGNTRVFQECQRMPMAHLMRRPVDYQRVNEKSAPPLALLAKNAGDFAGFQEVRFAPCCTSCEVKRAVGFQFMVQFAKQPAHLERLEHVARLLGKFDGFQDDPRRSGAHVGRRHLRNQRRGWLVPHYACAATMPS